MEKIVISVVLLCLGVTLAVAETAGYIPKSYYVIDHNGHKSDVVYLTPRVKRDIIRNFHSIRKRDNSGGAYATSGSFAGAGSSSYSVGIPNFVGGGGGFPNFFPSFPQNFFPPNFFPSPPNYIGDGGDVTAFASRFGDGEGTSGVIENAPGIAVSGQAQGPHGAFSSSSTSIDSNGKATYNVQNGHF